MPVGRSHVLGLYRALLRESRKFTDYNFRSYAVRRVTHDFHKNKNLTNPAEIQDRYNFGKEQLEVVRRQVQLGRLYESPANVIEAAGRRV